MLNRMHRRCPASDFSRRHIWPVLLGTLLFAATAAPAFGQGQSAVPWHRLDARGEPQILLYFFWSENCAHCQAARPFVDELAATRPWLALESFDISTSLDARLRFLLVAKAAGEEPRAVPTFIVCGRALVGYDTPEGKGQELTRLVDDCHADVRGQLGLPAAAPGPAAGARLELPGLGAVRAESLSLPVLTLVLGGLDAFNPCAFFVLLFLLSLLVHARSRARMALVGGVFVLASGLLYFAFMAAWLNLFLLLQGLTAITLVAGLVAVGMALLNIKDYFWLKQGPTLSVPTSAYPRLAERLRGLLRADRLPTMLAGTVALALAANSYELLCTSGFPLVYTRVLTLRELPISAYYGWLAAYTVVYVIPLFLIAAAFVITLGSRRLSETGGRTLKLMSGLMMLGLGLLLLAAPQWLSRLWAAAALLAAAGLITALVRLGERWWLRAHAAHGTV